MKIKKKRKNFYDIRKHGVTQSLLSAFLECRQKAKLYLQGWQSKYVSQAPIDGQIGHGILELAYTRSLKKGFKKATSTKRIKKYCLKLEEAWHDENPRASIKSLEALQYSLAVYEALLPVYFKHYKTDGKKLNWLQLESTFCVPITLPDGRKTFIRGKKDGEFKYRNSGLWLMENKFKAIINPVNITDTLAMDLQILIYLWAKYKQTGEAPEGALYNVVRRTMLRIKKGETLAKFARRVAKDAEERLDFYFQRFSIDMDKKDLLKFEKEFMGLLTDFYDWVDGKVPHYKNPYNCIGKYGRCDFISVCSRNEFDHLQKRKVLFQELDESNRRDAWLKIKRKIS